MTVLKRFTIRTTLFVALLVLVTSNLFAMNARKELFCNAEHIFIGDEIKIYVPTIGPEVGHLFHFPNGLVASYGDILAFGDFYEIEGWPISKGKSDLDRRTRFLAAFHSFTEEPVKDEAEKILKLIHDQQKIVKDAVKRGEDPNKILESMSSEMSRKLNCYTGGGCTNAWWLKPGRYLRLVEGDFDHFGNDAWIAYSTGHQIALETALEARNTNDAKLLETAYAMNAFASHFLSDRFAAGHIRTPRYELSTQVTPSVAGSVLSNYMHTEENDSGLHVHNALGEHWIAYGDRQYFSHGNKLSRKLQNMALQNSANQIFTMFAVGKSKDDVLPLIPYPDEDHTNANLDVSPLFYWDQKTKKLMRRENVGNLYDKHWTANWWGWSTLLLLSKEFGLPKEIQAQLARSTFNTKAIHDGLITDKEILNSLR